MFIIVNKLINKAKLQVSPNKWLTSYNNWPHRFLKFPYNCAYFGAKYGNSQIIQKRDLLSLNWIFKSIPNGRLNQSYPVTLGGFQNAFPSRKFAEKCVIDVESIKDHLAIQGIINAYQQRGHLVATIDPLGITRGPHLRTSTPAKEVVRDISLTDLNKEYYVGENTFIGGGKNILPGKEIIKRLEDAYCKSIGVEYKFIIDQDQVQFIKERFETPGIREKVILPEIKKTTFKSLAIGHHFESFLGRKFPNVKRFGLEGGEVLIPAMKYLANSASALGAEHFLIGMAHRGRMNVLANVVKKPMSEILSLFRNLPLGDYGSGDVKYHIGAHTTRQSSVTNKPISFSIFANPSHLECVCPIVVGKTYAEQLKHGNTNKAWTILIHGDAAICGQGVVYETIHLSELPCYDIGGVIHIVVNNQIGFTTDPRFSRYSIYCTEVGKVVSTPVIHVNGDDPDAVIYAIKVAIDYKHKFNHSIIVDIVCYRRLGHSEFDDPTFTQPLMYKKIHTIKPTIELYAAQLIKENVFKPEEVKAIRDECEAKLEAGYKAAEAIKTVSMSGWIDSPWKGFFKGKDPLEEPVTGAKKDVLKKIGELCSTPPKNFETHKSLNRVLKQRQKMIQDNNVDFTLGEAFAFGSILEEGVTVRMSGQDSERGTFSNRHSVYHHQSKDKEMYTPLQHVSPKQGKFIICNSSLSEFGIMGFELGFSLMKPDQLVLWEAQFGDFSNVAQCMMDQFISSGQEKWIRQNGLCLLLPHGLEGAGPEHSSCRPERFLQMCSDDEEVVELNMAKQLHKANWFVVNPSTPASYFHALRRQVKLNYRRPLIIFSVKSLLRHPSAKSPIDHMADGTKFKLYLKDEGIKDGSKVKKLFFCSGKVYYDLVEEREKRKLNDTIAICRLEQLFPFPYADLIEDAKRYPKAEVFWVQEEHKNQGFWHYAKPRLESALPDRKAIKYMGRVPSSTPATGSTTRHEEELKMFMNTAFN